MVKLPVYCFAAGTDIASMGGCDPPHLQWAGRYALCRSSAFGTAPLYSLCFYFTVQIVTSTSKLKRLRLKFVH